jgi:hypothetical protein
MRAGAALRGRADSVEIVIVSPFLRSELDRATSTIRGAWPGRMRVVPVAPSSAVTGHTTEVVFAGTQRPELAIARNRIDTVGAAIADGNVVVARFERRWRFVPDSLHDAQVVARWVDGEPAAIERDVNGVCTKSILVPVDSSGDMMLRSDFIAFAGALGAPCRSERADTIHATLPFDGRGRLASTTEFPVPSGGNSRASFWLLLMAMALAIIEMILRWSADGRGKNQ